jgi:glycosyltransferase involved in cell wall biosynthesis
MLVTELAMGGAAKVVRELSAMLATRFEVHEAVFNVADGVDFDGITTPHSLDVSGGGGVLNKLANLGRRIRRTRALKRKLRIDVSISHLEGAHWVDVLSRRGEKVVLCVHGSTLNNREIRGLSGWLRGRVVLPFIYNRADRIVTVSHGIRSELISLGVRAERIRTIHNSFDLPGIAARSREPLSRAEEQLFGSAPVLVTVGRLAPPKNQAALLDIFAEVLAQRPAKLLIVGNGELRAALVERAQALGLKVCSRWAGSAPVPDCDVYFLGVRSNPFNLVSRSDLFLMTSSWEGFPLALCEAMACGTPVLSTDCFTGPREIFSPDTPMPAKALTGAEWTDRGVLVPLLNDPGTYVQARSVWAETILRLLAEPAARERISQGAQVRVQDFGREEKTGEWAELIAQLATARS